VTPWGYFKHGGVVTRVCSRCRSSCYGPPWRWNVAHSNRGLPFEGLKRSQAIPADSIYWTTWFKAGGHWPPGAAAAGCGGFISFLSSPGGRTPWKRRAEPRTWECRKQNHCGRPWWRATRTNPFQDQPSASNAARLRIERVDYRRNSVNTQRVQSLNVAIVCCD